MLTRNPLPLFPCSFRVASLQAAATLVVANGYDTLFSFGNLPGLPILRLYTEDTTTGYWSRSGDPIVVTQDCAVLADTPAISPASGDYPLAAGATGLTVSVSGSGACAWRSP